MKKFISVLLCICLMATAAPIFTFAAGPQVSTETGTLIADIDYSKDEYDSYVPFQKGPGNFVSSYHDKDGFNIHWDETGAGTSYESGRGFYTKLNIIGNANNDPTLYQYGFSGTYAMELTLNMDMYHARASAVPVFIYLGSGKYDGTKNTTKNFQIRIFSNNDVQIWGMASKNQFKLDSWEKGVDYKMKFVVDTIEGKVDFYSSPNGGSYTYKGTTNYPASDFLQAMSFESLTSMTKGSKIVIRNLKLYEIDRYQGHTATEEINNAVASVPATIVDNPDSITSDITIPQSIIDRGMTISTTNPDVMTADGVITRGYDDEDVSLIVDYTSSISLRKYYNMTVKARDDIVRKTLVDADYSSSYDKDTLIYNDNGDVTFDVDGLNVTKTGYSDPSLPDSIGSNVIGMLKSEVSSDSYSKTYMNDHNGMYDVNFKGLAEVTGRKPAKLEVGNYNQETGAFTAFGSFDIAADSLKYNTNSSDPKSVSSNSLAGGYYDLMFRVDTVSNKMWFAVDGKKVDSLPTSYTSAEGALLNAYRVSIDENAEADDRIAVNTLKLTELENANTDAMNSCISAAENITIADVTSNPSDAYGALGSLPVSAGEYKIEWSTDSPFVDIDNKYAYRTWTDQDVAVKALVYNSSQPSFKVMKVFNIKIAGTTDPDKILEGSVSKLKPELLTKQDPNALYSDIALPEKTSDGYTIEWKSLNSDIISDSGVINKSADISSPAAVTLKATVTGDGNATVTRDVKFTVAKRGADIAVPAPESAIKGVSAYETTVSGTSGSLYLKDGSGKSIAGVEVSGGKITLDYSTSDGQKYDFNDNSVVKFVVNSNVNAVCIYIDGKLVAENVLCLDRIDGIKGVYVNGLTLSDSKILADEYTLFNYCIENYGLFNDVNKIYINKNISLPACDYAGVAVSWKSSNENLIAADGTFKAPSSVSFVNIDFAITCANGSGAKLEKTFECVALPQSNSLSGASFKSNSLEDVGYPISNLSDGDYTTAYKHKVSSNSYIQIDMGSQKDINALLLAMKNDDTKVKACTIEVSGDAKNWKTVKNASFGSVKDNLVMFDMQNTRYLRISGLSSDSEYADIMEINGYVIYSSSDKCMTDIQAISMPSDYTISSSLTLPSVGSVYGSALTWVSSNTDIISTNGTVTRPEDNTEVTLTVTAALDGATATKTFTYLVLGSSGHGGGGTPAGGGGGSSAGGGTGGYSPALPTTNPTTNNQPAYSIFSDVATNAWYYNYLVKLKAAGVVNGVDGNKFCPDNYVTREEFVKMIVTAAKISVSAADGSFSDVGSSDWFAPYVYAAKNNGIVNGISDGRFGVGSPITRQDMAVIIYNLIKNRTVISQDGTKFTDDKAIADYAGNAVYAMKTLGVISGYTDGSFKPAGLLTRAEAVKVISMIIDMY